MYFNNVLACRALCYIGIRTERLGPANPTEMSTGDSEAFIHRLPDDLLIDIFYYLVVDLAHIEYINEPNSNPYSWIFLAHVCLRWAHVVNTTPLLWTSSSRTSR